MQFRDPSLPYYIQNEHSERVLPEGPPARPRLFPAPRRHFILLISPPVSRIDVLMPELISEHLCAVWDRTEGNSNRDVVRFVPTSIDHGDSEALLLSLTSGWQNDRAHVKHLRRTSDRAYPGGQRLAYKGLPTNDLCCYRMRIFPTHVLREEV